MRFAVDGMVWRLAVVTLLSVLVCGSSDARAEAPAVSPAAIDKFVVEAPTVGEAVLSPDGSQVAYTVTRASVADNQHVTDLFLQVLGLGGVPSGEPLRLERAASARHAVYFALRWCPELIVCDEGYGFVWPMAQNRLFGAHGVLVRLLAA